MADAPRIPIDSRHRKRRNNLRIVGGVLVVLAGALAYAAREALTGRAVERAVDEGAESVALAKPSAEPAPVLGQSAEADTNLIDDDGQTLWASPTHGPPLDLTYMQPDAEIILAIRPAELLAHSEGDKILAALGPLATKADSAVQRATGMSLGKIEQLVVGWRVQHNVGWVSTQILHLRNEIDSSELRPRLKQHLSFSYFDRTFVFAGDRVYYMTDKGQGPELVDGTTNVFEELFPREPLLPRDVGRLVRHTDATRQLTLIFRPQFLLGDQHDLFAGAMAPLRPGLEELFGDDVSAAALSMNWDENFFIELLAVPTLDSSPEKMSHELAARVNELPKRVEEHVLGFAASHYSRRVVARLPEMVRTLAAYTRYGFDQDAAVLRCYLPVAAGHNLIMGAELALAERDAAATRGDRAGVATLAEASSPESIAERLQKKTSLRFAREELEAALDMLAQDVGVKIVIRGPDLQLDGITRNQLFAIDMADQPAETILVEILRRANPEKLATGPADPRQKLVYVVGPEAISITTRSKAAERGEPLPALFRLAP